MELNRLLTEVSGQFGAARAEYFEGDALYDHFTAPSYWPELRTPRPCFLVGGRGTGKTTVLRSLSYQGTAKLEGTRVADWSHIGIYSRIDTNVVTAFSGGRLKTAEWSRIFGHYLNLSFIVQLVDFLIWAEERGDAAPGVGIDTDSTLLALQVEARPEGLSDLRRILREQLITFEADVNNVDDGILPRLSVQGRPINELVRAMTSSGPMRGKTIYFLLDEFENLSDYQQRCLNTLIKHSGDAPYTFKIGVRETGHREVAIANSRETLIEPSDFVTINISDRLKDQDFAAFAARVCSQRLARVSGNDCSVIDLYPGVSAEEEAKLLGVEGRRRRIRAVLKLEAERRVFDSLSDIQAAFVGYWSDSRNESVSHVLAEFEAEPQLWKSRLNNHQHAMLFTLRRGISGQKKLYSGWDTYVALSDGNIRYLLQLVGESLSRHLAAGEDLAHAIDPVTQTAAAQDVGQRIVRQLPGMAAEGAQLAKLVLGFGRVFQVMASQPEGHTPEVNQFRIDGTQTAEVTKLLNAAVMHLAVVRFPGDKRAGNSGETRDWNYMLHPVFSAYFVYSHRRKRRISVSSAEVAELVSSPNRAIEKILQRSNRPISHEPLPEQLNLFGDYYGATS